MFLKKLLIGVASVGLVFGSTAAVAAPNSGSARTASRVANSEHLAGIGTLGILLGLAVVAGVIAIIATDHNHHNPVSP